MITHALEDRFVPKRVVVLSLHDTAAGCLTGMKSVSLRCNNRVELAPVCRAHSGMTFSGGIVLTNTQRQEGIAPVSCSFSFSLLFFCTVHKFFFFKLHYKSKEIKQHLVNYTSDELSKMCVVTEVAYAFELVTATSN